MSRIKIPTLDSSGKVPVSQLPPISSGLVRTAVKTANYAAAAGDLVACDPTGGAFTVTLPSAPADKAQIEVKIVTATAPNAVTIACSGSDVLNRAGGAVSTTLQIPGHSATFQYDAATHIWTVIQSDTPLTQLDARYQSAGSAGSAARGSGRGKLGPYGGAIPVSARYGGTINNFSNGTDTGVNAISSHKATADCADLRVVWANWHSQGSSDAEAGPGNAINLTLQLEYPAGVFHPVYFNGVSSVTAPVVVADAATAVSDIVGTVEQIPKGDIFWVHCFITVTAGQKWINNMLAGGNNWGLAVAPNGPSWITGEGFTKGTAETNKTGVAVGGLTSPTTSGLMPGPLAVIAQSIRNAPQSAVVGIGDSILNGNISTRSVNASWLTQLLADRAGYVMLGRAGGSASNFINIRIRNRGPLLGLGAVFVNEMGINDIFSSSASLATIQATLIRLWRLAAPRALYVLQTTITPEPSSTDFWTTLGNQSIGNSAKELVRTQLNDWLRAGAPIDASYSPLAIGTGGAILMGSTGHPLKDIIEVADAVESARNSGLYKVPGVTGTGDVNATTTISNVVGNFANGSRIVGPFGAAGAQGNAFVKSGGGTSTLTTDIAATATATGVALAMSYTSDGIHPTPHFDTIVAASLDASELLVAS